MYKIKCNKCGKTFETKKEYVPYSYVCPSCQEEKNRPVKSCPGTWLS